MKNRGAAEIQGREIQGGSDNEVSLVNNTTVQATAATAETMASSRKNLFIESSRFPQWHHQLLV
jgi:hypothetical protein